MSSKYGTQNLADDSMQIPSSLILGVKIAAINMTWLIKYIHSNLSNIRGEYITVCNVHTTVTAFESRKYLKVQNGALMALPDGAPLSKVMKKRGISNVDRVTGPDFMVNMLNDTKHYRHFFYGSTPETLHRIESFVTQSCPNATVCGLISPPFRKLTDQEDIDIVKQINESHPDFIWIGLGAPKQELWMAAHQHQFSGVMVGVGAGFDYLAGNIKRAPKWMQTHSLEWLYRLLQDPRRLISRYMKTNLKFIRLIFFGTGRKL